MTAILGISAYYHDSAACLIVDGELVAAAQEERFTRRKHDERFPTHAVQYCLSEAGLTAADLDLVGFYEKPYLTFDRLLETYVAYAPRGYRSFVKAIPIWVRDKLHIPRLIRNGLGKQYKKRIVFAHHHESHAASAFFPSPFDDAAVLTLDGVGEWATTTVAHGRGNRLRLLQQLTFPHSLGLLYSAFTYYCGFKVNSGEYKLMGLAPYGEPRYRDQILEHLVQLREDGSFRLDMRYFDYAHGLRMTSSRFHALFGGSPRQPETPISQREMDLAASVQAVTEEIVLRCARHAHAVTGSSNLCLAGGVALNCVANGRVLREGPFENVWIQPAAGDAGGALGVASLMWYQLLDNPRAPVRPDQQRGSLLGPRFGADEIARELDRLGARYQRFDDDDALVDAVAGLLADAAVVGWMQGRMEFGPRALGARSILGDPRSTEMQSTMNLKIKFRESFRPFAPSVLREAVHEYFEMRPEEDSPYMLLVAPVRDEHRLDGAATGEGFDRLKHVRSTIPAVTHVDYSARVQTVDPERHGRYRQLLERFRDRTGCPVLVNTSFNVRGEPVVCTPADAYRCFMATNMDALVIEGFLLRKEDQPAMSEAAQREHVEQFALD